MTRSIKTNIFLFLIVPFILIGGASFLFASYYLRHTFTHHLEQDAQIDTTRIANTIKNALLSHDTPLLTQLLFEELYSKTPFVYLSVFDMSGNVMAHTSLTKQPSPIPINPTAIIQKSAYTTKENRSRFTVTQTIMSGPSPIGLLSVDYEFSEILSLFDRTITILLTISLFGLLLIFFLALRLSDTVIRPLTELSEVATDFAGGNLLKRASVSGSTETKRLAQSFNDMAQSINESKQALLRKQGELELRLEELESWKTATIGRELKMIELKKQLEKCEQDHKQ